MISAINQTKALFKRSSPAAQFNSYLGKSLPFCFVISRVVSTHFKGCQVWSQSMNSIHFIILQLFASLFNYLFDKPRFLSVITTAGSSLRASVMCLSNWTDCCYHNCRKNITVLEKWTSNLRTTDRVIDKTKWEWRSLSNLPDMDHAIDITSRLVYFKAFQDLNQWTQKYNTS